MKELLIVTTGGTIDKIYYDALSDFQIGEPIITDLLEAYNVDYRYEVIPLLRKDSLELTDDDRRLIRDTIASRPQRHVLITHGTDTMVNTAQVLMDLPERTIVLTGALNPARFHGSDAVFNIGCAIGALQVLGHGVWLAMNGRIWHPEKVRKNRNANRFEPVEDAS